MHATKTVTLPLPFQLLGYSTNDECIVQIPRSRLNTVSLLCRYDISDIQITEFPKDITTHLEQTKVHKNIAHLVHTKYAGK